MPTFSAESLAAWSGGEWQPSPPEERIDGISTDTRTLVPGNIYVALKGENFDGHEFVQEALDKGAIATVVRSGSQSCYDEAGRQLNVRETLAALRDFASGYLQEVAPRVTAITGSVGKSTVKEMTAGMLRTAMPTASTIGNWNNHVGVPLSVLAMEEDSEAAVFEVGTSNPGEIASLCALLVPSCGVVTNVGAAHLESFGTIDRIVDEKCDLLRSLPADGVAVLCVDSSNYEAVRAAALGKVITVSTRGEADYTCVDGGGWQGPVEITETDSGEKIDARIPLPGEHNARNAMMAIAVARQHGVSWDGILSALDSYARLPMRWAEETIGGVLFINDAYNANPISMGAALDALAAMRVAGRKWLVLGDMLELGDRAPDEHVKIGRQVAQGDWAGLVTVGELGGHIATGAEGRAYEADRVIRCKGCSEAALSLHERVRAGDAVLVKASRGMKLEGVISAYKGLAGAGPGSGMNDEG